jgi:putative DNA primase/helicase
VAKTQGSDGQTAPDLRDFILSGRVTIDDLRQCRQWVLWKYEQKKGKAKPAKVPYGIDGKAHGAIEGNRDYWGTYGQVAALVDSGGYSGVGVVLTDGLCGIDIDGKHFPDGHNPEQDVVIELMDSYTEKSPSGQGVHILFTCDLEPDEGYYTNNQASGLECYIDRPRFFTFTGDAAEGYTIESRTERARTFLDTFMVKETATGDGGLDVPGLSYLTDEQVLA